MSSKRDHLGSIEYNGSTKKHKHDVVQISSAQKAAPLKLGEDGLTLVGEKGYRMALATHGVERGEWFFEISILRRADHTSEPLPYASADPSLEPHFRLGFSTRQGDLQSPVGYDKHSFAYRDVGGTKVHESRPVPYGEAWGAGDTIGFLICFEAGAEGSDKESHIRFFKNGADQGIAFDNLGAGLKYFPALSIYNGGVVRANFGPVFAYPPAGAAPKALALAAAASGDSNTSSSSGVQRSPCAGSVSPTVGWMPFCCASNAADAASNVGGGGSSSSSGGGGGAGVGASGIGFSAGSSSNEGATAPAPAEQAVSEPRAATAASSSAVSSAVAVSADSSRAGTAEPAVPAPVPAASSTATTQEDVEDVAMAAVEVGSSRLSTAEPDAPPVVRPEGLVAESEAVPVVALAETAQTAPHPETATDNATMVVSEPEQTAEAASQLDREAASEAEATPPLKTAEEAPQAAQGKLVVTEAAGPAASVPVEEAASPPHLEADAEAETAPPLALSSDPTME